MKTPTPSAKPPGIVTFSDEGKTELQARKAQLQSTKEILSGIHDKAATLAEISDNCRSQVNRIENGDGLPGDADTVALLVAREQLRLALDRINSLEQPRASALRQTIRTVNENAEWFQSNCSPPLERQLNAAFVESLPPALRNDVFRHFGDSEAKRQLVRFLNSFKADGRADEAEALSRAEALEEVFRKLSVGESIFTFDLQAA